MLVTLPSGIDPGTAHRFTELWVKAFQEVASAVCPSLPFDLKNKMQENLFPALTRCT